MKGINAWRALIFAGMQWSRAGADTLDFVTTSSTAERAIVLDTYVFPSAQPPVLELETAIVMGLEDDTIDIRVINVHANDTDEGRESVSLAVHLSDDTMAYVSQLMYDGEDLLGDNAVMDSETDEWTVSIPSNIVDEEEGTIQVVASPDWSGVLSMDLVATSSEARYDSTASTTVSVELVVAPVADAPWVDVMVVNSTVIGEKDQRVNVTWFDLRSVDSDGSESASVELRVPDDGSVSGVWLGGVELEGTLTEGGSWSGVTYMLGTEESGSFGVAMTKSSSLSVVAVAEEASASFA